jgi:hypothetical protein
VINKKKDGHISIELSASTAFQFDTAIGTMAGLQFTDTIKRTPGGGE